MGTKSTGTDAVAKSSREIQNRRGAARGRGRRSRARASPGPVDFFSRGTKNPSARRWRCKLQGQRVDPLPPPWGNMVNYVADPLPAVLWVAKLGRGYPPPGVGNGVNYTRRGSNSGEGPDGLATLAASVSGDDGRCSADGGGLLKFCLPLRSAPIGRKHMKTS